MKTILYFIFLLTLQQTFGQEKTSYKYLETVKFYGVSLSSGNVDGTPYYKVNGKDVEKSRYNTFFYSWNKFRKCCPCILKTYDENDTLISESIQCTDAIVGYYKSFYSNGNIKSIKHYKENTTGSWKDLCNRDLCNVPHGTWTFFNEHGDSLYTEYWKDGNFIRQVPEQDNVEMWNAELLYNGLDVKTTEIEISQINQIKVIPKFKNKNIQCDITVTIEISAIGYRQINHKISMQNLNKLNIIELMKENGMPSDTKANFSLLILGNGDFVRRAPLKIKKN
ncbi:MAG: hypothetical protein OEW75_08220 [Cyclobacteriaceae bacterium]|nr:hypothetical protein [Cyclobacteriaceae bacterium]